MDDITQPHYVKEIADLEKRLEELKEKRAKELYETFNARRRFTLAKLADMFGLSNASHAKRIIDRMEGKHER